MKEYLKVSGVLITGLISACLIYPLLHELGHSLAALCVGAKVHEIRLFPIPYILCSAEKVSDTGNFIIGLSGMVFPQLCCLLSHNNFWLWYISFVVAGICGLSFLLSIIALVCHSYGSVWANEDVIQILKTQEGSENILLMIMLLFLCFSVLNLRTKKPLRRIADYFGI